MNTMQEQQFQSVERLVALTRQVRRQNRLLKTTLLVVVVGLCGVMALGAGVRLTDANYNGTVTALRFAVVDSQGRELMSMGRQDSGGTGLVVYDKNGEDALMLGIDAAGESSGLVVQDSEGRPRIGLGMDGPVPSLAVADTDGDKLIALGAGPNRYGIVLYGPNEVERVGMAMGPGGPISCVLDKSGRPRAGMVEDRNGECIVAVIDEEHVQRNLK